MPATLEIGKHIHAHSHWLGKPLVDLADQALSGFDGERCQDSVTYAGRFLEGVLKRLLDSWAVPYGRSTFGELIAVVRGTDRLPKSLLDRLSEANKIRNRLFHEQEPDDMERVNEGDALLMLNISDLLVSWSGAHVPVESHPVPADLPVFLSVGRGHRLDQERFLQHLHTELRNLGVDVWNLSRAEFSEDRPFDQVREVMSRCHGALVVGLERSHAYAVFEREASKEQKRYVDRYIPTAWNQIEGAIASALQLPLMILKDRRLHDEGIFETRNTRHRREDFDLSTEAEQLSPRLRGVLAKWSQHVRALVEKDAEAKAKRRRIRR